MAGAISCPSVDRLRLLLTGSPPADEQTDLIAHLDDCTACQQMLEQLAGADPALLRAAHALQPTTFQDEASLRRLLDSLSGDVRRTRPFHPNQSPAWLQSILQPADSPEHLGRFDQYQVAQPLGQGGMGLVLKAFDPPLKRWVAIKVLAPDLAGEPLARLRFAREAQAAAAVRHPNVVTIHAVSEANGLPYLVMEYVAGGSLQDHLDRHGPPAWQVVARLGAEVACGLAAAHARGLIHRDIKPSNILLEQSESLSGQGGENGTGPLNLGVLSPLRPPARTDPERDGDWGTPKISDFGLARAANESRLTRTGVISGTPMFMAPEQALGAACDHRADLFSLGSVIYTLATGHDPFPADNPLAVLKQVCETRPRPIRELNPAVPDWLAAIVERLHAKRPEDRFASAAEVAELLQYNLEHPDQPRTVAPPRGVERTRRRILRLGVGVTVVVALLIGGLTVSELLHWTRFTSWGTPESSRENPVLPRATLIGHQGPVWSVAFAPDGETLATGSDDATIRLWEAATGKEIGVLQGHKSAVFVVAFAHSGTFLVSGGGDGTLRQWDVTTRKPLRTLPHRGGNVRRLVISPDDTTVATGGSAQDVELWDLDTHKLRHALANHHGTILAIAYAPNGKILATGDASGYIQFWDPATGAEIAQFRGDPLGLRALAFAPDGQTLASAGNSSKEVKLWDVASRQPRATFSGFANGVLNVAFSPNGRLLATGSRDGTAKIWDVASTQELSTFTAHQGNVWAVAFSPDGFTLATGGEDGLGKLWDLSSLEAHP